MVAKRIPLLVDQDVEAFTAGAVITTASKMKNLIPAKHPDGRYYVTQRAATNITANASDTVSVARGRGLYKWSTASALYFANGPDVYKGNYSAPVREGALTLGVGSLTSVGAVATVAHVAHGYVDGDTIVVAGATQPEYNGTFTVSSVAANSYNYTMASAPGVSPATTATSITTRRTIKSNVTKLYFYEVDDYLVVLDPEDGRGWYIAVGASTTLVKITDLDFPSSFARGGCTLNGRLYVLATDGTLYGSDEGNPATGWTALNSIIANYSPDAGVLCAGHNKHVVTFGANTIEFFYDAANPTGSSLSKRPDVVHEIGAVSEDSMWSDSNIIFFVGQSRSGGLSVYVMSGLQIDNISSPEVDSMLTTAYLSEDMHFHASGAMIGGRMFYMLTIYSQATSADDVAPVNTLVFTTLDKVKMWCEWELMYSGINKCPIVDWSPSTTGLDARGILSNGDIIAFQDDMNPQDLEGDFGVFESGVFVSGVFVQSGGTGTNIDIEIITGSNDFKTQNEKRMDHLRVVGARTAASQTLTVSVSDDVNDNWVEVGTIDLSVKNDRINRLGSFQQRNFKLTGAFNERVELEALETDIQRLNR